MLTPSLRKDAKDGNPKIVVVGSGRVGHPPALRILYALAEFTATGEGDVKRLWGSVPWSAS
jgi:hypothetical protein